jgi:hypothetical protein
MGDQYVEKMTRCVVVEQTNEQRRNARPKDEWNVTSPRYRTPPYTTVVPSED